MKHLLTICAVVAFVLAISGLAQAATINVPTDQLTIQAAIDAASDGDTIVVADGVYNENVNVNKAVTLVSVNGSGATTIQGSAAQSTAASGGNLGTLCLFVDGIAIGTGANNGFTIAGYDWALPGLEHAAIYIKNHGDLIIIGNSIVADGEAALLAEYGCITNGNVEIAFNEFSGQTYVGVTIGGDSSVQFTTPNVPRSMIYFGGDNIGIYFHDNVVGGSVGGVIEGTTNTYYNTGATIDCKGATSLANGAVIDNNIFTIPSWASLRARGSYSTVTNNVFDSSVSVMYVGAYYENFATFVYENNQRIMAPGMTIQQAIDAAYPGDTINVAAGTYDGNLIVYKEGLTIQSTDGAPETIIDASKVDKSTYLESLTNPSTGYTWAEEYSPGLLRNGFDIWSDDVTIDGFTIINAAWPDAYNQGIGILLGTISTTYAGFVPSNIDEWGGLEGAVPITVSGVTVKNNIIDGASDGIYIWASGGNTIEYNKIRNTKPLGGGGIQVYEGGTDNIIRYNTIENAVDAISICGTWPNNLLDVSNTQVIGNTITGSTIGIKFYNIAGADVVAQENDLRGNDIGIKVESVGDATVASAQFNNLVGNTMGVQNEAATGIFDATCNWWGDASGPGPVGFGSGDAVSLYVDYDPWLSKPWFQISKAKIEVAKDKASVKGILSFNDASCGGVSPGDHVIVTVGPVTVFINGADIKVKDGKWEYKGAVIKKMKIDWTKGVFEFSMAANFSGLTNPVTISLRVGSRYGEQTVTMAEKDGKWEYKGAKGAKGPKKKKEKK